MGAAWILSCHPKYDHYDDCHHPSAANGDHPNHAGSEMTAWGEKFKSSTSIHKYLTGSVTVSPKPTSVRTLCWKKTKTLFLEGCWAGVQFQRKKNHLQTPTRWESYDFSCHSTEPTQKAWKSQFWPGISLSLVWLPHSTFVKGGQPVQKGLPLCNF